MILKRINRVLFYTLLVFSLFSFIVYPESRSKYIKEENPLIYGLDLQGLFIGDNDTLGLITGTTYETAKFYFRFERSQLLTSNDESVNYRITLNEGCSIERIDSDGTVNINGSSATIKYQDNESDTIYVTYTCDVANITVTEDSKELISTKYNVYETYQPDDVEYLYTRESYKMLLSDYYVRFPLPTGSISADKKTLSLPAQATDKYQTMLSWLTEYAAMYGSAYEYEAKNYFKTVYSTDEDTTDLTKSLLGLSVTYNPDTAIYTYVLDDNYLGYARTKYAASPYYMFFTDPNMTSDRVKEVFDYYVTTYLYPNDQTSYDTLMEYINAFSTDGIYHIFADSNNKIPGIVYYPSSGLLSIRTNILSIIETTKTIPVKVAHDTTRLNMIAAIEAGLMANYSFITQDVIDFMGADASCYEFGSYMSKTQTAFNRYFAVTPITTDDLGNSVTHNPILFNIYSDYVEADPLTHYNYVVATELVSGASVELEYSVNDIAQAKSDITTINTALNLTMTIDDAMFTTSGTYNDGYFTSEVSTDTIKISFIVR